MHVALFRACFVASSGVARVLRSFNSHILMHGAFHAAPKPAAKKGATPVAKGKATPPAKAAAASDSEDEGALCCGDVRARAVARRAPLRCSLAMIASSSMTCYSVTASCAAAIALSAHRVHTRTPNLAHSIHRFSVSRSHTSATCLCFHCSAKDGRKEGCPCCQGQGRRLVRQRGRRCVWPCALCLHVNVLLASVATSLWDSAPVRSSGPLSDITQWPHSLRHEHRSTESSCKEGRACCSQGEGG